MEGIMAKYRYSTHLHKSDSTAYDVEWKPGQKPVNSGIYRCTGCGHEVVAEKERSFPTQNKHQHTAEQGEIRWKLLVFVESKYAD